MQKQQQEEKKEEKKRQLEGFLRYMQTQLLLEIIVKNDRLWQSDNQK